MTTAPLAGSARALSRATRLQRAIHALRTEGDTRGRESLAIGLGLMIGCTPFWGVHFGLCWLLGRMLRLNRLKMYLAANVINPLIVPPLFYAEVQAGALVRRGHFLSLSWDMLSADRIWAFGADLVVGSVVVGVIVGLAGGIVTWAARRPATDPFFQLLVRRASDRYLDSGITAWEFARGKLSGDPVYAAALSIAFPAATGTLLDIGCGQGLTLALVAEAQQTAREGAWDTSRPDPPQFDRLVGVELRPRIARIAARALEHEAEVVSADAREAGLPGADVVLLFDVLHMLPDDGQRALLRAVHAALGPTGRVLVREADASAGWRYRMVRLGNRLKALVTGSWRQRFLFRTSADWRRVLHEEGFVPHVEPMGSGTPFANVLITAGVRERR
ncbi:hypothetical protein TBR22_A45250 [Luteitalea sp. TBR-22]|uniref:DUF2062 domain-containing protein n=1 Tax=Luteitalea sp. TBR-22 TaxID=2802971 RepID=UPI001AF11AD0|nr:DUF2062 domain-containing protein [Luteitalea sp. TBR-22]BCS35298.1 hypothetical protein TBR22_A45250 [Luteitalea sp. TBR-22]